MASPQPPPDNILLPLRQLLEFVGWAISSTVGLSLFAWLKQRYQDRRTDRKELTRLREKERQEQYEHERTYRDEMRHDLQTLREMLTHEQGRVREKEEELERVRQQLFAEKQRNQMLCLTLEQYKDKEKEKK